MFYKYEYTRLLVTNFKACFLFYRDVMGFKPTFGAEDDVYADFDTGGLTIALFERKLMDTVTGATESPAETQSQDRVCLVFGVDDVDAASQHLATQGVHWVAGPQDRPDWGIRTLHFRDPDGNLIELNQPLKRA